MDANDIETYLRALDERLGVHGRNDVALVVCGGAAMNVLGLSQRTTRDIDTIAIAVDSKEGGFFLARAEFDYVLREAIEEVARDFGLPEDWINSGPAAQFGTGLPDGIQDRFVSRRYGENLVVHYCSRLDLIFLKLYAAVDVRGRHLDDLKIMSPDRDEIEKAAGWCLSQDVSEPFKELLLTILEELGYGDIAGGLS